MITSYAEAPGTKIIPVNDEDLFYSFTQYHREDQLNLQGWDRLTAVPFIDGLLCTYSGHLHDILHGVAAGSDEPLQILAGLFHIYGQIYSSDRHLRGNNVLHMASLPSDCRSKYIMRSAIMQYLISSQMKSRRSFADCSDHYHMIKG